MHTFPTLEAATARHYNQAQNPQLEKPKQGQQGDLTLILVSVAGTIFNNYTNKPLTNMGLTRQKAYSLASKLSCHTIQRKEKSTPAERPHALRKAGRVAEESRRVRASRGMADNPPDPH
eukprot:1019361-Pelagomonas_calceolata.AAC.1